MKDRLRILHVLLNLHFGGVETFAFNLLRNIDKTRYSLDFAVVEGPKGMNEPEARALGARIFRYRRPRNAIGFVSDIERILEFGGPYDIVHSHLGLPSTLVLLAAHKHSITGRIAHAHSAMTPRAGLMGMVSRFLPKSLSYTATRKLAVSRNAAESHYGASWTDDPLVDILPCGITFPLEQYQDRKELRKELGLPEGALILISVGRMVPIKNQEFLLSVLSHLLPLHPSYLLLVGDGPLKPKLAQSARENGLEHNVLMPGHQTSKDVARYLHAADVFALPSHSEGLPMSAVEAQAAGLPCILSTGVPREVSVIPELTSFICPSAGAREWALAIYEAFLHGRIDIERAREKVRASELSISSITQKIEHLYERQTQ